MNDELSNQLSSQWRIPTYAQDKLWVATEDEAIKVSGENGLFTLQSPADFVTIRWGAEDGTSLAQLKWRSDSLDWTGFVRMGGLVESMHYLGAEDEETTLAVVSLSGQVLKPKTTPYARMTHANFDANTRVDMLEGLDREDNITTSTWIVTYHSPLYGLCQDALNNKLMVYFWGRLIEKGDAKAMLTPLHLSEITLFAT
jgi:hypothetical protein